MNYVECAKFRCPFAKTLRAEAKSENRSHVADYSCVTTSTDPLSLLRWLAEPGKVFHKYLEIVATLPSFFVQLKHFQHKFPLWGAIFNSKSWKQRAPTPMTTGAGQLVHWLVQRLSEIEMRESPSITRRNVSNSVKVQLLQKKFQKSHKNGRDLFKRVK